MSWALVAHTCDPSYSGGRNQEDRGSKPAWANSSARPYLKKSFTQIGLMEWLKVKVQFKVQYHKKKKKRKKERKKVARCNSGACL
jgi:hypothetical protein